MKLTTSMQGALLVILLAPGIALQASCRRASDSTSSERSTTPTSGDASLSDTTSSEGPTTVTSSEDDKAQIIQSHRDLFAAAMAGDTARVSELLDDSYTLTHITGYVQPKEEWLAAITSGEMQYHAIKEDSVTVDVTGDKAVLVGRSKVTATINGSRGTWNLQSTTTYARKNGKWIATKAVATTY
jgi:hypothetical protein